MGFFDSIGSFADGLGDALQDVNGVLGQFQTFQGQLESLGGGPPAPFPGHPSTPVFLGGFGGFDPPGLPTPPPVFPQDPPAAPDYTLLIVGVVALLLVIK